ncbi:TNF receptor-associated factor 5-like isoform X3 [Hydra vulgaris]|uniref:TNF receptor-associated factor 5-like isoform X3 n=1 Tax=Hydra vulgaris TaxID=6087 RepID=UPI0032EA879A
MEHRSMQRIGGYDAPFLNDFIEDYECPVCKMAFCEPIQTQCGHRLCLTCSEEIKKCNKGVLICPLDKKVSKPDKTFPDKAFERAVQHLQVKCKNFMKNCRWTGDLRLIDNHLENCKYQEVSCPNELCTASVLRKELMEHMETDCIFRLANCQYCYLEILYLEMQGTRNEQDIHASSSTHNHLSMAMSKVIALETKISLMEEEMEQKFNVLERKFDAIFS